MPVLTNKDFHFLRGKQYRSGVGIVVCYTSVKRGVTSEERERVDTSAG